MTVVADTGVLYALVDANDAWHGRVVHWWERNREPILVPVSVLPEVTYLLQTRIGADAELAFVRSIADGEFQTEALEPVDYDRTVALMEEYSDFPLGFVDASVMAVAERVDARDVLTTDRLRFGAVRPRHARGFRLVP
jgi:predicted nucleic acid-binding protein